MRKIVYCLPALYSAGGVERMVSFKASYFAEAFGYDVTIILTDGRGADSYFPLSPKVKVINYELGFEQLWRVSFLRKILMYLRKQRQFKRLLTADLMRLRPDFTISVLRREINFLNGIRDGSLKIGELHVNRSNYRNFSLKGSNALKDVFSRFWMGSLLRHLNELDRMVVLTDVAKADWPEVKRVSVIPNPIPFQVSSVSMLSARRVVCVTRYSPEKGVDLLLQVWKRVEAACPQWHLDVYGMGGRDDYEQLMSRLQIDGARCHLHGSIHDVRGAYLASSAYVLPSRFEGFGLSLIEAMACGLPVVAFDCENGPRSIISDGVTGYLVPAFDVDVFADRLIRLIDDEQLRREMGGHARKASEKYAVERIAREWTDLFSELERDGV